MARIVLHKELFDYDAELRKDLGLEQAQLELQQPEARMRDVDALHQVRVRLKRVEPGVPCHGGQVLVLREKRRQRRVVGAIRIRECVDRVDAVPLQQELRQMHFIELSRCIHPGQRVVIGRMAADLNAAVLHITELFPIQIARLADLIRDDIDRRLHAVFLKDGQQVRVVVLIAIVKGQDNRLRRQFHLAALGLHEVEHRDGRVALLLEVVQLLAELLRRHIVDVGVFIDRFCDFMVLEDRYPLWRR